MKELIERIQKQGQVLRNGILKVDSFINHQVDPVLMDLCGREFARRFAGVNASKVLTAEISGIAPAVTTALHLNIPVVYARKTRPVTMPDAVLLTLAPSHTKGVMTELIVSPEYLGSNERVLIIDDFLASGATIMGLVRLAKTAGAQIVGIGTLIEKSFEGGRALLTPLGVPIESLAVVTSMENGKITFAEIEITRLLRLPLFYRTFVWILNQLPFLVPAKKLRQTDHLLAFFHPNPGHPFHVFLLPRASIRSLEELEPASPFLPDLFAAVQSIVHEYHLPAFRLIVNAGGYQDFPHLHFHLVSDAREKKV